MKIIFCLLIAVIEVGVLAQNPLQKENILKPGTPESVGFSSSRLERIDNFFEEYIAKGWCPGGVALIARKGTIVYYEGFGYNDIETKTPFEKDAVFRIASQTKAITSVAVMMLYEEGKFLLDDPVSKYLPEFKNQCVIDSFNEEDSSYTTTPVEHQVTIRELLTHTSGLGYPGSQSEGMNYIFEKNEIIMGITDKKITLKEQMTVLGKLPLSHQPGEKFTYGLSVDVLGYLVEVVSGVDLNQFFNEHIFEPLGMQDTYFYLPKNKYERLAELYGEDEDQNLLKVDGTMSNFPKEDCSYYSGGAGLVSTAYDYSVFLQMLANGGEYNGKRYLSPTTIEMMTKNQIGDLISGTLYIPSGEGKFGLGFEIITEEGNRQIPLSVGTYGWGGTFGSLYWIDPAKQIVAQLVLQMSPNKYNEIRSKFINLVYQAIIE
ncbi:MAG: serine hydrolase domain-containing protein [Ignavibacteria bacterium]|jgi:CubicO group peptidase (beta-lactamase class C family)